MKNYIIAASVLVAIILAFIVGYRRGGTDTDDKAIHEKYRHDLDSLQTVINLANYRIYHDDDLLNNLFARLRLDSVQQIEDEHQKQAIHGYYQKILHSYDNAPDSVLDGFLRARIDSIRQRNNR